ncbi:YybS family protein [Romboutsia lituseburensis]|uniref:YybS family protein n=1 Tax=Romboutsia lituseburensis TaxID=1537 RepID=UPI00215AEA43|nr:YybS family protein [Romboutsia lituseburensis]MCR8745879.1 YybS family protein [Romboutsia lituseburensis]
MNNKVKLSQASMIVTLGILLALMTAYIPFLGILVLVIPVPYAIIGTLTDNKYSVLALIATFFILMFTTSPVYAVSISIVNAFPGIVIGRTARVYINGESNNKFEPIYMGIIAVVVSIIIFYLVSNFVFGTNILDNFIKMMKEAVNFQPSILENAGLGLSEGIKVEDFLDLVTNMIPAMLFLQGIVLAFVIYYMEVFILRRTRQLKLQAPKFADFYLPGNAIVTSLMLYLLVLLIDMMGIKLHTDLIMMNLQLVFNFLFIIQGIAVAVYYVKKWFKQNQIKNVFISGLILSIFGFIGVTFVGMLDSIIDFRKVRSDKSI